MRLWSLATRIMGVTLLSLLFATAPLWAEMTVTKPTKPVKANGSTVNLTIKFTGEEDLPITLTVTVTPQEIISDLTGNEAIVNISKGKGTGKVSFKVLKNETSLSRSIDVTINNESFTITQAGQPCKVSIAQTKASFDCPSGAGSFDVTAPKGCQWKAWNADETADDWIKNIVAVKNDEGGGSVSYDVDENLGKNRSGKILVAGFDEIKQKDTAKKTHTVAQKAAPPCKVAISPSKASFTYDGGEGSIDVTAPAGCSWNAAGTAEWITLSTASGIGNGTVTYHVAKNSGKKRSGRIHVAGISPVTMTATAQKTHAVAQSSTSSSPPMEDREISVVAITGVSPAHLALRNGTLFWSEASENAVRSVSIDGGSPVTIASRLRIPVGVAVAGQDIIWLEAFEGAVTPTGYTGPLVLKKTSADGTTIELDRGVWWASSCSTTDLIVHDGYVYWVMSDASDPNSFNTDTYIIRKTPIGGGPSTNLAVASVPIVALAIESQDMYWVENVFAENPLGAIRRVSLSGGSPVTLVSGVSSGGDTFAINDTSIFYTQAVFSTDIGGGHVDHALRKVPLTGGSAVDLAELTFVPGKLAADNTTVYWLDSTGVYSLPVAGGTPVCLAISNDAAVDLLVREDDLVWSSKFYFEDLSTGVIRSVPKTGGAVTVLYRGPDAPQRLFRDSSQIYFTEKAHCSAMLDGLARIARIPDAGGAAETLISGVISYASPPLAVSDTHVFLVDGAHIMRVPLSGGILEPLGEAGSIYDIVTDGAYVYWVESGIVLWRKMPVAGGVMMELAATRNSPSPGDKLLLRNDTLYLWTYTATDCLEATPVTGGGAKEIYRWKLSEPKLSDFIVDETNIYFAERGPDKITPYIKKIPLSGGAATIIGSGASNSLNILAQDDTYIYWMNTGGIFKAPKTAENEAEASNLVFFSDQFLFGTEMAVDDMNIYWLNTNYGMILKMRK
jgi:hypothetical protein